jgi:2,4-dienoyl-CoA reductase-like NADH-dependent reductase (Old Yellow Enzyme family)
MTKTPLTTLDNIRAFARSIADGVKFSEDISILKTPLEVYDFYIPNRIAIQPIEAADADEMGKPTNRTYRRYIEYAKGCAGLIWFEACAVDFPEARTHESMLVISEENLEAFKRIVVNVKKTSEESLKKNGFDNRAFLVLQLSHAGRYRILKSGRSPAMAFRFPEADEAFGITADVGRVISDSELEDLMNSFVQASIYASEAGFDAVDIKACHGYLLNDLLASFTRDGMFGGKSFENRSKFILETMKSIISDTDVAVTSRINAYDGFPHPYGFGGSAEVDDATGLASFDSSEPIQLIKKMNDLGVDLINISLGNPYYSQYLTRPFDSKMPGQRESPFHPIKGVEHHFDIVATLKRSSPRMKFLGSGYSWLRKHGVNAAAYNIENSRADIAGWGRLAIAFPDFPKELFKTGYVPEDKVCITCSGCSILLRAGRRVGCVKQNSYVRESLKKHNTQ